MYSARIILFVCRGGQGGARRGEAGRGGEGGGGEGHLVIKRDHTIHPEHLISLPAAKQLPQLKYVARSDGVSISDDNCTNT